MMIQGEVEFLADTILLQKVATIQYGLHKTAGFGDTLKGMLGDGLSSISSGVRSELGTLVDTGSTESVVLSLGQMIMTGGLFLLWPPLGIINAVARATLGIDAMTIAQKIWRKLRGPLQEKGQVTQQEVSAATREVTLGMAGSDNGMVMDGHKSASYDLLEPLRIAESNGQLYSFVKHAFSMEEMAGYFSKISPFKSKSIVGGMVGWAIKAALLGAGLMFATGSLARLVGLRKETPKEPNQPATTVDSTPGSTTDALYRTGPSGAESASEEKAQNIAEGKLTPTGRGTDYHTNDHVKFQWIVPMVGGSIQNTLVAWARDVYLEMSDVDDSEIKSSPSFNKIVSEMSRFLEFGSRKITIPPRYKTRKQIVDQFAYDVINTK